MLESRQHELKLDRLKLQTEILAMVRNSHQAWANETGDSETSDIHLDIVKLLRQLSERFEALLDIDL